MEKILIFSSFFYPLFSLEQFLYNSPIVLGPKFKICLRFLRFRVKSRPRGGGGYPITSNSWLMKKTLMYTGKRTVFINDTHCGSDYALKSPLAEHNGQSSGMTKEQEQIWEHWRECAKEWKNPDCMIFNGDLIDGAGKADKGSSVWTPDLDEQSIDFKNCLKHWGRAKVLYAITGTPYHVKSDAMHVEEIIARDLGAVKEKGRYASQFKLINLAPDKTLNTDKERIIHITHHMGSTSSWQYRGSAPSRAMAMLMLNESHFLERNRKIFGIVRAHVHHYWQEKSASRLMQVLPCWQLPTNFMLKVMPESPPDLGCVRFTFHNDGTWEDEYKPLPVKMTRPKVHQA